MNLQKVEAGAQGEHKIQHGYLPVTTYSCHYILDEELRRVTHGSPVIGIAWNNGENLLVSSDADGTVIV
ncbi:hypothetical protein Syun_015773 [Stephania yunnanensis]|uniref:Uncharacterized protein n=1 Tax=Stephania yunnanensis TaxID=152371 RepID=A0AAP0JNI4_9MAGN